MTSEPHQADARHCALLSVVVPCFDEEAVIPELHRRLVAALERIPETGFEVIYVDDGSRDATLDLLRGLQAADARVRIVALSRNFGQEIALTAGMAEAAGDAVAIMDADLQDPPEVIAEMLERWRRGADVAYGVRSEREGESAFKRWTAKAFYRLMARLTDVSIPLDTGQFRLMDRVVVDAFLAMPERDRFVRGMVAWTGFRQESVRFHRAARTAGQTKYPLRKLVGLAVSGILSFSLAPVRAASLLGACAAGLGLAGIVYALAVRVFTGAGIGGWAATFIAVLFLGGAQLMLIGILGEYLGRVYREAQQRPLYLVRERLGFPADPQADSRNVRRELRT